MNIMNVLTKTNEIYTGLFFNIFVNPVLLFLSLKWGNPLILCLWGIVMSEAIAHWLSEANAEEKYNIKETPKIKWFYMILLAPTFSYMLYLASLNM